MACKFVYMSEVKKRRLNLNSGIFRYVPNGACEEFRVAAEAESDERLPFNAAWKERNIEERDKQSEELENSSGRAETPWTSVFYFYSNKEILRFSPAAKWHNDKSPAAILLGRLLSTRQISFCLP